MTMLQLPANSPSQVQSGRRRTCGSGDALPLSTGSWSTSCTRSRSLDMHIDHDWGATGLRPLTWSSHAQLPQGCVEQHGRV